jgi:hypothetical protein
LSERVRWRLGLLLLVVLSIALRVALARSGGQRYFPDENRYLRCFILERHLGAGDAGGALDFLVQNPDHTGFILVGLPAAVAQDAAIAGLGAAPGRDSVERTLWLPAALLSLCSVAVIGLVHALACRAGADESEALIAAFLTATSGALLYYSRHLLPYDAALALALAAAWIGLRPPGTRAGADAARSLAVGLVASAAFLTYNGYWLGAATAVALHAMTADDLRARLRRAAVAGLGLASLPALLTAASLTRGLGAYARKMARFSRGAATQTDFGEGWSLPWAYLWHAEHALLVVFGVAAVSLLATWRMDDDNLRRGRRWLAVVALLYALMVVLSVGAERIGTFGRITRQLVPFLCLAAAAALRRHARRGGAARAFVAAALAVAAVQIAFHATAAFRLQFPAEIARLVFDTYGPVSRATTVDLGPRSDDAFLPGSRYVLLNARYLYPIRGVREPPAGTTVFAVEHPARFRPYQYEGYRPAERAILREADVSMRLLDTAGGR